MTKQSIIVVGPDRVGKTTITRRLNERLGIPVFKCPAEKQIFRDGGRSSLAFDYTITHFLSQTGYRFISDRGYPCEWVYSKVFGRETDMALLRSIDDAHRNLGTKILYLYSSEIPEEADDLVPKESYWSVKNMYDAFTEWSGCQVFPLDTLEMLRAFSSGGDSSDDFAVDCIKEMGL